MQQCQIEIVYQLIQHYQLIIEIQHQQLCFKYLNSLSMKSILSIHNLNASSTTLLNMMIFLTGVSTISDLSNLSTIHH